MLARPIGELWERHLPELPGTVLWDQLGCFAEGTDMPAIDLRHVEITMQLDKARDAA